MERVARELIPAHYQDILRPEVDAEEDDDFVVPDLIDDLPQDRRIMLEGRNALVHPAEHEASGPELTALVLPNERLQPANARDDPPPQYTREPRIPHHVSSCVGRDSG